MTSGETGRIKIFGDQPAVPSVESAPTERAPLPEGYEYADPARITPRERAELMRRVNWNTSSPKVSTADRGYESEGISMLHVGVRAGGGRLAGYGRVLYKGEQGELCDLVVDPVDQHNGIGRAIIDEQLAMAEAAGVTSLYMPYLTSGNSLRSYYAEKGFHETLVGELVRGPDPVSISGTPLPGAARR